MINYGRALPVATRHRVKTERASSPRQSGGFDIISEVTK